MCLRDCFALGLALTVSGDTPTSPSVTFGLFNLIAVQSRSFKACCLKACRSSSAFSRATSPSVYFIQTWEVSIWSSSTATWSRAEILEAHFRVLSGEIGLGEKQDVHAHIFRPHPFYQSFSISRFAYFRLTLQQIPLHSQNNQFLPVSVFLQFVKRFPSILPSVELFLANIDKRMR